MDSTSDPAWAGDFHNTEPRTREERLAARAREKLEQNMLRSRRVRGCSVDWDAFALTLAKRVKLYERMQT